MSPVTPVAAAIFLRLSKAGNLEFLLARRARGKFYSGYWEFPGGKLERGEDTLTALYREITEELGVSILSAQPAMQEAFIYPHAHVHLNFFYVTHWQGRLLLKDHNGFAWIPLGKDVKVAPLLPANHAIMQKLKKEESLLRDLLHSSAFKA